jgi:NTE family protein
VAHIGVIKVLEQAGVPIDLITGTSMGGMIGAIYAAGVSPAQIEEEALRRGKTWELLKLVDLRLSQSGLLKGNRIYEELAENLGPDLTFADLRVPLAVVAVDMPTGREVVLREGNVIDAVRATISVPGVFIPVQLGPYRLVDGGVLNNVPVDVARAMGADVVIAVNVMPDFSRNQAGQPPVVGRLEAPGLPRPLRALWHIQMIMISALTELQLEATPADVLIHPELPTDMDLFVGFDRPAEAIAAGEVATKAALSRLQALLWNRSFWPQDLPPR